jgi:hypothetical protein
MPKRRGKAASSEVEEPSESEYVSSESDSDVSSASSPSRPAKRRRVSNKKQQTPASTAKRPAKGQGAKKTAKKCKKTASAARAGQYAEARWVADLYSRLLFFSNMCSYSCAFHVNLSVWSTASHHDHLHPDPGASWHRALCLPR